MLQAAETPTPDDLVVAALVLLTALVAFIAVLCLNRQADSSSTGKAAEADSPQLEGGTVLKEEASARGNGSSQQPGARRPGASAR